MTRAAVPDRTGPPPTGPMSTGPTTGPQARALAPVATALVERAERQAAQVRAAAERTASAAMEAARRQAAQIEAEARGQGRAEAEILAATERAQARRAARAVVLRTRAEVYADLRDRVREGVRGLRTEACYPRLIDRLTELAREAARAEAGTGTNGDLTIGDLTIGEPEGGGVVAVAPGLRIDLSSDALADRAVELLGAEVMRLWEPRSPG